MTNTQVHEAIRQARVLFDVALSCSDRTECVAWVREALALISHIATE